MFKLRCVGYSKRNKKSRKKGLEHTNTKRKRRGEIKELTEILRLLAKAIEQNTVNTYQEQGSAAADVVFRILEDAEKRIDALDRPTEKGGEW